MKKLFLPLLVLLAGTGIGGGAAYATTMLIAPHARTPGAARTEDVATSFVPVEKIMAPLVTADGRLSGYVAFDIQLEVPADQAETVTERLPLLLHAINMRTYRTPMAAGPDGLLPDLGTFRTLVMAAAPGAFGSDVVRRVAITQAVPA